MEITKEFLIQKKTEYLKAAEQAKLDSIANAGAADAIQELLNKLEAGPATPPPAGA